MIDLEDLKVELIYGFGTPIFNDHKIKCQLFDNQIKLYDSDEELFKNFNNMCLSLMKGNRYDFNHN